MILIEDILWMAWNTQFSFFNGTPNVTLSAICRARNLLSEKCFDHKYFLPLLLSDM